MQPLMGYKRLTFEHAYKYSALKLTSINFHFFLTVPNSTPPVWCAKQHTSEHIISTKYTSTLPSVY